MGMEWRPSKCSCKVRCSGAHDQYEQVFCSLKSDGTAHWQYLKGVDQSRSTYSNRNAYGEVTGVDLSGKNTRCQKGKKTRVIVSDPLLNSDDRDSEHWMLSWDQI